jgi:hypothetical protein
MTARVFLRALCGVCIATTQHKIKIKTARASARKKRTSRFGPVFLLNPNTGKSLGC